MSPAGALAPSAAAPLFFWFKYTFVFRPIFSWLFFSGLYFVFLVFCPAGALARSAAARIFFGLSIRLYSGLLFIVFQPGFIIIFPAGEWYKVKGKLFLVFFLYFSKFSFVCFRLICFSGHLYFIYFPAFINCFLAGYLDFFFNFSYFWYTLYFNPVSDLLWGFYRVEHEKMLQITPN